MGEQNNNNKKLKGFAANPQNINRKGRPWKGNSLTEILRKDARRRDVETRDGRLSRAKAMSQKLWALALSGDLAAIKYIYDRLDGVPGQKLNIEADIRFPEAIEIVPVSIIKGDNEESE
jgi:hypothetical protein